MRQEIFTDTLTINGAPTFFGTGQWGLGYFSIEEFSAVSTFLHINSPSKGCPWRPDEGAEGAVLPTIQTFERELMS